MLEIGTVLDEKYEILKLIDRGGTSTVYLAMNQKLNQQWVIKEIDNTRNVLDAERVLKEARMMMSFDHPAIPRIVDILKEPESTYIIMDYVSGQSLAYELKEKGPQPQEIVLDWAKQICNVLVYLHSLNPPIIYHDLKPGNIILKEPEKNLKLIDFGEARACINGNAPSGGKTREYAAPEQQRETRGKTDERTDIYCFGTTLYRLLTGKFAPISPEPVGSIRDAFPELNISKGMDNIIKKCTQIDSDKRFQNATELMNALENIRLWDDDYLNQLKNRVRYVGAMAGLCVGLLTAGIVFNRAAAFVNAQDYDNLVSTALSVDYETRIGEYEKAVQIDRGNPTAYIKLLEAYEDNGTFGNRESQQFSTLYNRNKNEFDAKDALVIEMHYLIGRIYFNMYSDDSTTIRSRVQKAHEYFRFVKDHGSPDYKNYSIAYSYYTLCDFFKNYVLNDSSIQEPTTENYRAMLVSLQECLNDMQNYVAGDAAYTRMKLYGNILDMLNVNIRGLAVNGIEKKEIQKIITQICTATMNESVTQQTSIRKQEEILALIDNVLDNIRREYENLERGQ